jgi:hypothetical protein
LQFKLGLLLCSKDLLTVPVHVSVWLSHFYKSYTTWM